MTVRLMTLAAAAAAFALHGIAGAATYTWTDDQGVIHFTDNPDRVPPRILKRAEGLPSVRSGDKDPWSALPSPPPPPRPAMPPSPTPTPPPPAPADTTGEDSIRAARVRLGEELQKLRDGLPVKREELERLRRKWVTRKGRTPTAEEIKIFNEKKAAGEAKEEDNPFFNKNPLSSPGIQREAYYKKLEEIRSDEARILALQKELDAPGR
jgi:hypothetical protein